MFKFVGDGSGSSISLPRLGSLENVAPAKKVRAQSLHFTASSNTSPDSIHRHDVAMLTSTVSSHHQRQAKFFSNSTVHALHSIAFVTQYTDAYIWQWQQGMTPSFDDRPQCWTSSNTRLHLVAGAMRFVTPLAVSSFLRNSCARN